MQTGRPHARVAHESTKYPVEESEYGYCERRFCRAHPPVESDHLRCQVIAGCYTLCR